MLSVIQATAVMLTETVKKSANFYFIFSSKIEKERRGLVPLSRPVVRSTAALPTHLDSSFYFWGMSHKTFYKCKSDIDSIS
jgi:hypothetical protein